MFGVRIRVGSLSEEDELLVAIGPMLAEVEECDGDEEESGDLQSEGCPEKIAGHWEFRSGNGGTVGERDSG